MARFTDLTVEVDGILVMVLPALPFGPTVADDLRAIAR
jgi:hypothetical protein